MELWKRLFKRKKPQYSQSTLIKCQSIIKMFEKFLEINKTNDYDALKKFAKEIGAYIPEKEINLIHIDKIDGAGGFVIPYDESSEEIIKELLKNPDYILRGEGRS